MSDRNLVHAIETIVIQWTHQVRDVLKKDSAQPLLEGLNPSPFVEIEFWKAKALNLQCIHDQVKSVTRIHSYFLNKSHNDTVIARIIGGLLVISPVRTTLS